MPEHPKQHMGHVRWDAYSHQQMWNMVMDARPDDVFDRYDRWRRLGDSLIGVNKTVQAELSSLFQTWQGTAAMGAALSNTRLLDWSQQTADTTHRIGEDLGAYGNALVEARKRMPQPRVIAAENEFRAGDGATVWSGPENAFTLMQLLSDHRATTQERDEAKERAIDVMRTFEADSVQVHERMDTYTQSPDVVNPLPPGTGLPPVPPAGSDDDGTGIVIPDYSTPAGTDPAGVGPAGAGAIGGGPGGGGYGVGSGPGLGGGAHGPGGQGAAAGPGQFGPGQFGAGGPGGYTGRGLGVGAGEPGAAGRYGAVAEGAGGRAGVGQSFGATNRGPGVIPEEGVGGRGTAGGRAGAGAGGMYPPMAGGGMHDDEHEKRVAPYLMDADDLFDDERTVAPPVFGA